MRSVSINGQEVPAIVQTVNQADEHATLAIIQRQMEEIERLKVEKKNHREMLQNLLENDKEFGEKEEARKAAAREVKTVKNKVMVTPEATGIIVKMDDVTAEIKSLQESLSNHLMTYHVKTGKRTFEDAEGDERTIVFAYKVKPKQMGLFDDPAED